ncbi:MAG: hypothetical protein SNF33_06000 [Candidatus Algichlamydia australiensis]|nr:hypothetical protein [Chlamydiales bacterium]
MSRAKFLILSAGLFVACTSKPAPVKAAPKPQPKKEEPMVEQNCTNPKLREGETLNISLNMRDGKYLQLSDDSVWKINPADIGITSAWLTPATIDISKSSHPDYPCLLTNRATYSSVSARRLASIDEVK